MAEADNRPGPGRVAGTQSPKIRPHSRRNASAQNERGNARSGRTSRRTIVILRARRLFNVRTPLSSPRPDNEAIDTDRSLRTLMCTYVSTYVGCDVNASSIYSRQPFRALERVGATRNVDFFSPAARDLKNRERRKRNFSTVLYRAIGFHTVYR